MGGGIELSTALALGAGEAGKEVLVDAAQGVLGPVGGAAQGDAADQVDDLSQALLVETRAGVVLGQYPLEAGVVALDGSHGVVDNTADGGLRCAGLEE